MEHFSSRLDWSRRTGGGLLCVLLAVGGLLFSCTESGPTLSFEEVTAEANLDDFRHQTGAFGEKWFPETMGSGGGFIDYNGDGHLDILLVGGGVWEDSDEELEHALWLYRNNGDGTFTLVTEKAGLGGVDTYGFGVTVADYDNDGEQDFLLTTLNRNLLFRNNGDGTFTEVGREAGLTDSPRWSSSALFFDADNDGFLDLYVGNYVKWSPENDLFCSVDGETKAYCTPEEYEGVAGRFYHNEGDGTFSNWTDRAGFSSLPGKTLGAAMLDYNHDGAMDLYVANDMERNLLFENNGDGTFEERGTVSGTAYNETGRVRAGMGVDAGIVDSTGEPTIFVGNFSREKISVFRHRREGLFEDRSSVSQVGPQSRLTLAFGLFLFDGNLDGALDLFVANGHVQPRIEKIDEAVQYKQPPHLFLNEGDATFKEKEWESGPLAQLLAARGAAYGDYDQDGDLDILVTENQGGAHLWQNNVRRRGADSGPNHLRIDLEGRASNRDGIGTRVRVEYGEESQTRLLRSGSSYLSANELVLTFGLGEEEHVDRISVHWPSGTVDRLTDVDANQTLHVVEGQGRDPSADLVPTRESAVDLRIFRGARGDRWRILHARSSIRSPDLGLRLEDGPGKPKGYVR